MVSDGARVAMCCGRRIAVHGGDYHRMYRAVAPPTRHTGVGTLMLAVACARAHETECLGVVLHPRPDSTTFYTNAGGEFREMPEWTKKVKPIVIDGQAFNNLGDVIRNATSEEEPPTSA